MEEGSKTALHADESVVPASEVKRLEAKVRELERLLGKKSAEVEVLKDAVLLARKKKLVSDTPLQLPDGTL